MMMTATGQPHLMVTSNHEESATVAALATAKAKAENSGAVSSAA